MTSRVAEMARQAAAEVRTRGLAKGDYIGSNGRMCTLGLISFVDTGNPKAPIETLSGYALHRAFTNVVGAYIPAWNDAPERTAEDVALMFERVAEQFESAGVA